MLVGYHVDRNTFPSLFSGMLYALFFILSILTWIFTSKFDPQATEFGFRHSKSELGRPPSEQRALLTREGSVFIACYLACIFPYWCFVVASFPFSEQAFQWTLKDNYFFYMCLGAGFCVVSGFLRVLLNMQVPANMLIAPCVVLTGIGGMTLLELDNNVGIRQWQLYLSAALLVIGFAVNSVLLPSLFSQLSGVGVDDLSTRMSWFFCVTCLVSAAGPVTGALLIDGNASDMTFVGKVITSVCLASISSVVAFPFTSKGKDTMRSNSDAEVAELTAL